MSYEMQMLLSLVAIFLVPLVFHWIKLTFTCSHDYRLISTYPRKSEDPVEGPMRWVREDYDLYKVCTRCGHYYGVGERYD